MKKLLLAVACVLPLVAMDERLNHELRDALRAGHFGRVSELIAQGADPNTRDESGWPILLEAATNGDTDAVRMLINAHADVNMRDERGWTALMLAARYEKLDVLNVLLDVPGIDVNAQTRDRGFTALMLAAQYPGNAGAVRALLAMPNVDVNAMDHNRETALDYARRWSRDAAIIEMISAAVARTESHLI